MKKMKSMGLIFLMVVLALVWIWIYVLPLPGDVPILMYHFAGNEEQAASSGNILTRKSFQRQMNYLQWFGYRVISMEDYAAIVQGRRRPKGREIVLTFDDGNETYASDFLPILQAHHFPSTIFLVSESVKGRLNGSMSEEVVREVIQDPLVTLGAHTKTHPFLPELNETQLQDEILNSKKDLEAMFGRPVRFFSYPFGDFNAQVAAEVQKTGYELAFSTSVKKLKGFPEGPFSRTRSKMMRQADNPFVFLAMSSGVYKNFKRWRAHVTYKNPASNQS